VEAALLMTSPEVTEAGFGNRMFGFIRNIAGRYLRQARA
jgi:hypothetical protein